MKIVSCPTCKKEVIWTVESKWRPFCSERCKLVDLGEWIDEKNRIIEDTDDRQAFMSSEPPESLM